MTSNEITSRLVRGSRNIDRMKDEVDELVRLVICFALSGDRGGIRTKGCNSFETALRVWHIFWDVPAQDADNFSMRVECWVRYKSNSQTIAYDSGCTPSFCDPDMVQTVYEGLPVFVEGMLRLFPDLADKWAPLIKAADVYPE